MAQGSFTAQINAWVAETKQRTEAVRKESAQRVVAEMQLPGPSVANPGGGAGGHLPIDTGFLRASLTAIKGFDLPPTVENPDDTGKYNYDAGATSLLIAGSNLTDTLTFVYTAVYARKMEERYAFVRLASQQWQRIVSEVATEAQARAG